MRFRPVRAQVADALAGEDGDVREALLRLRTVVDGIRHATDTALDDAPAARSRRGGR